MRPPKHPWPRKESATRALGRRFGWVFLSLGLIAAGGLLILAARNGAVVRIPVTPESKPAPEPPAPFEAKVSRAFAFVAGLTSRGDGPPPESLVAASRLPPFAITSENLMEVIQDLYFGAEPSSRLGRRIELTGMIFHEEGLLGPRQAVVGMYFMTCCALDAMVAGILVETEGDVNDEFLGSKEESWWSLAGVLEVRSTPNGPLPVLRVTSARRAPAASPFLTASPPS